MLDFFFNNSVGVLCLTIGAVCDCVSWWLVKSLFNKYGQVEIDKPKQIILYFINLLHEPRMIIALAAFIVGPAFSFLAMNRLKLTEVYPIVVVLHVLLIFLTGYYLLGEEVNRTQIIGLIILLSGLFVFYTK